MPRKKSERPPAKKGRAKSGKSAKSPKVTETRRQPRHAALALRMLASASLNQMADLGEFGMTSAELVSSHSFASHASAPTTCSSVISSSRICACNWMGKARPSWCAKTRPHQS